MASLVQALHFLISTLFDLYLFVLIMRLVLVWVRVEYWHPLTQMVVKLTDFIVKPLRTIVPNFFNLESATLLLIIALEIIKLYLLAFFTMRTPHFLGISLIAAADIINFLIQLFFYAILMQVIVSWIQLASPMNQILLSITSPILHPLRRIVPLINGIDITPIPALILLQLVNIVLVSPLQTWGLYFL